MKKIIMILAPLCLIILITAYSNKEEQKEPKVYKYVETLAKNKPDGSIKDTIKYYYAIIADDDRDAYLQAYEMFLKNLFYITDIETKTSPDIFYTPCFFQLTNRRNEILEIPDFPNREEEVARIRWKIGENSTIANIPF
ncbi:hypothetical protein LJC00_04345 [Dysgonomonas sp. OttesenSCG-928-M03]|nr:hypothetical protein [Dysgonomonas sp. OttesenSCG-928-M03]